MEDQGVLLTIKSAIGMDIDMRQDKNVQAHLLGTLAMDLLMQVVKKKTRKEVQVFLKTWLVSAERVREMHAWPKKLEHSPF